MQLYSTFHCIRVMFVVMVYHQSPVIPRSAFCVVFVFASAFVGVGAELGLDVQS